MGTFVDYTGKVFGRLTVLHRDKTQKGTKWVCQCSCGNLKTVVAGNLQSGNTTTCGCMWGEKKVTHGHRYHKDGKITRTYSAWSCMKTRCNNPNQKYYKDYGARGITYCQEWEDFSNFLKDMGECPPQYELERNDVNGNYSKENCCWVTVREQQYNKRNSRLLTYNGVTRCLGEWAYLHGETIRGRVKKEWTIEEALTIPKGEKLKKPQVLAFLRLLLFL